MYFVCSQSIFCYRNSDPEPNPPCFSSVVVRATFDYLTQKHSAHASSCVMLLARAQVLHSFAVAVLSVN